MSSAAAAALRGEAIKAELVASHVRADDLRAEVALLHLHSPDPQRSTASSTAATRTAEAADVAQAGWCGLNNSGSKAPG